MKWVKVAQSCPTLCNPMVYTVHGVLQARILEWVAFPFSRGSSQPRDWTQVSCTAGRSSPAEPQGKPTSLYFTSKEIFDLVTFLFKLPKWYPGFKTFSDQVLGCPCILVIFPGISQRKPHIPAHLGHMPFLELWFCFPLTHQHLTPFHLQITC